MSDSQSGQQIAPRVNTLLGAAAGIPLGALVGAACCWQMGLWDALLQGTLIGTLAGPLVGALIGYVQRMRRTDLIRPEVATLVGICFGLLAAVCVAYKLFAGGVGAGARLIALAAVTIAGPMLGMMIGGVFDRAFDEALNKRWGASLVAGAVGLGVCVGLISLIDSAAYGPDPTEIGRLATKAILDEWSDNPELSGAKIKDIAIVREGRTDYSGSVVLTVVGEDVRFTVEAAFQNGRVSLKCTPVMDHPPKPVRVDRATVGRSPERLIQAIPIHSQQWHCC